jgi:hypothetical protein
MNDIVYPLKLQFTNKALLLLIDILQNPTWPEGWKDGFVAGQILTEVLPFDESPFFDEEITLKRLEAQFKEKDTLEQKEIIERIQHFNEKVKQWNNEPCENFTLQKRQVKTCSKAIRQLYNKQVIPSTRYTFELMTKLGLSVDLENEDNDSNEEPSKKK